ncbi:HAD superfamily hydrolase (TIGR01509 family)/HAD superfamily hydrolase (TIGR01549 family) [Solirubrobacter pauli]|uniref:HAD superfamily hydrolase (TIGR01509 family)/HAD superfamily hydrolase (TIGR01549 family) n=1 Tax=Solirubrobacter pauli TaxID=166793 RepID=A0A660L038_9ACTN|nr:HAD-IA family hydrolase [Solirubrobacter pauli]RKQ87307.1 HAD superfamily hydrolase (TIGR01509 family)/HAD superfamily hydrolase (TIGR01549 family) [Solirubrobacter pauli]
MSGFVIFDLDGVLVDSEQVWDQSRKDVVAAHGRQWTDSATTDMLGMSSKEWPVYLIEQLGVPLSVDEINEAVVAAMLREYHAELPLLPGAREVVERLRHLLTLGLASSSNRPIIDVVLSEMGVAAHFKATVSSEEVARGKPAPDVYLEALRRLDADTAVAIEDSEAGIRSAHAAGLYVIAIPNPHFPPSDEALALADQVLENLDAVTYEVVAVGLEARYREAIDVGDVAAWVRLGDLLANLDGREDEAAAAYRTAVEADVPGALGELVQFLFEEERFDEAAELFAAGAGRGEAVALHGLGVVRERQGAVGEAETLLRQAIDAGEPNAHATLARLLSAQFRDDEAAQHFRAGARAGDEYSLIWITLHLRDTGRGDEAEALLSELVAAGVFSGDGIVAQLRAA